MSDSRAQILGQIRRSMGRDAVAGDDAAQLQRRLRQPRPNLIPARVDLPHAGLVDLFAAKALQAAAEVTRVSGLDEVPGAVAEFLARHNLPTRLRMAPDPALDVIPWDQRPLLHIERGRAEETDRVSVTPAFAGVAETGTLMLTSSPRTPTTLHFMPENHVVVLKASQVVGSYEDGWAKLRQGSAAWPGGMPRTVNLITGPSRTADIEQKLYMGAHGPLRLQIVLVDDGPQ